MTLLGRARSALAMKSASLPVLQVYAEGDGTGAPVPTPQHPVTVFLSSMGWVVYVSLRFVVKVRANVWALAEALIISLCMAASALSLTVVMPAWIVPTLAPL